MNDQVAGLTFLLFLYIMQMAPSKGTRSILLWAIVGCGAYLLLDNGARHEVMRNPGPILFYLLILLVGALIALRRKPIKEKSTRLRPSSGQAKTALTIEPVAYHPVKLALIATGATGAAFFVVISLGKSLKLLNVF